MNFALMPRQIPLVELMNVVYVVCRHFNVSCSELSRAVLNWNTVILIWGGRYLWIVNKQAIFIIYSSYFKITKLPEKLKVFTTCFLALRCSNFLYTAEMHLLCVLNLLWILFHLLFMSFSFIHHQSATKNTIKINFR